MANFLQNKNFLHKTSFFAEIYQPTKMQTRIIVSLLITVTLVCSQRVVVDLNKAIAQVDPKFVSTTIDVSQVLASGVEIDFSNAKLKQYISNFSPALLRVGGTLQDEANFCGWNPPLPPYKASISCGFFWQLASVLRNEPNIKVTFGLNGGPGPRKNGTWDYVSSILVFNMYVVQNMVVYCLVLLELVCQWLLFH